MERLGEYIPIVGQSIIDDLKLLAERLKGKVIQQVNSTSVGGGVAEILNRMIPLLKELGVDSRWDFIKGGAQFFDVTKKFHNALHGKKEDITKHDFEIFEDTSRKNIEELDTYGDIVFIHDPQPVALVKKKKGNKWVWRCHIDVSRPNKDVWNFLKGYIKNYDSAVFSAPSFCQKMPIRQFLISPSIDPLSDKNRELPQQEIDAVLRKYEIEADKPIITQISRFDRLKDPVGVIDAYLQVKKYIDCQLILAGGTAVDDPEGAEVLAEVREKAKKDKDIHILLLPQNDLEVNALQRASTIIMQKSSREGFGLTVSEALWKTKPVVATDTGGIPLQIKHKYSGLLCHSIEGAAFAIKQLLNSPGYAKKLAENGREHVRNNFLITRHIRDYMLLFLSLYHPEDVVSL
ncbi:MAG: glycosyl transferase family 1 [Candidatus Omnitrophica bacterium CG12_big_fil_rev_8_21_14_0_65_43_15]|uniref:Glycosyl transferase family 1 n=1 Tax=Candidatus Taenaricola geysiri TaxID=1974752 RepID=A0A2J0LDW2_9BACT|nr:MAG: glycosyl transferase family 1 [Candidatus Omnitrophica bacterium CG12_big_fil_rev_8_21_14_0_65_43_15]PIW80064.1 MAG: glycosyl transferase family 1 [Candidatus Omnitrophica bacterium CG_4_8_14_3_um_filter_43_15]PIY84358.1 MAG: glycosyl transferase family 1 [Candidatus Omnitrophica bacterium CG_4_10_14_0_8_um_filter_43_18]PJC46330.1 MAG: glycosyl transferase family 1 [Candidatus Omnitrophica bacterium CG_4_9_14_0_2_um_filter_43_12]